MAIERHATAMYEKVTVFYTEEGGKNVLHKMMPPKSKKGTEQQEDR